MPATCDANTCGAHGTCRQLVTQNNEPIAICICDSLWTGNFCETPISQSTTTTAITATTATGITVTTTTATGITVTTTTATLTPCKIFFCFINIVKNQTYLFL